MKKIKFAGLNFGSSEILLKTEQKKVLGGGYGEPGGGDGTDYRTYKCCYKFDHQNCSTCAKGSCLPQYDRLAC